MSHNSAWHWQADQPGLLAYIRAWSQIAYRMFDVNAGRVETNSTNFTGQLGGRHVRFGDRVLHVLPVVGKTPPHSRLMQRRCPRIP